MIECGERARTVSSYAIFEKDTSMRDYLAASDVLAIEVRKKIKKLQKSQEPIYVWGLGSNWQWLKENTDIHKCNIQGCIDGRPVGKLENYRILITPVYLATEIQKQIKRTLPNESFTLWRYNADKE
jgi:hypothetical protein